MLCKGMIAVGAALVLASSLVATTGASAARRGSPAPANPAVNSGGHNATVNAAGQKASTPHLPASSNGNFGFSGPYIGEKFIGNK